MIYLEISDVLMSFIVIVYDVLMSYTIIIYIFEKNSMRIYIEAIILYSILFLSGAATAAGSMGAGAALPPESFPVYYALTKSLFYSIPAFALIWYLILKDKPVSDWKIKPVKNDFFTLLITVPGLLLIGLSTTFAANVFGETQVDIIPPSGFFQWLVLCVSCMGAAYLEESYFRFYLLTNRAEMRLGPAAAVILSTALFSICHIYEGPWGFLNSFLSGVFLCVIFLRRNSIHGIALAHGLYNVIVYIIATI